MTNQESPQPTENPLSKLSDDEIRERARELHGEAWAIEIPDDAQVIRPDPDDDGECARVAAWIYLGPDD